MNSGEIERHWVGLILKSGEYKEFVAVAMVMAAPMFVYVVALGIAPCCWDHFLRSFNLTPHISILLLLMPLLRSCMCWMLSAYRCFSSCFTNVHRRKIRNQTTIYKLCVLNRKKQQLKTMKYLVAWSKCD